MRMSELFGQTRRKTEKETLETGSELLIRAGFIRQLAAGIYTYMPLALRVLRKIESIVRSEIENIGGQELLMPVVNPAEIWKESGRWQQIDAEMGRFQDRSGRDMVLAMTHEEVVADLVRNEVHSYRQLPRLLYHFQIYPDLYKMFESLPMQNYDMTYLSKMKMVVRMIPMCLQNSIACHNGF